jgi:hypothetical protein
MVLRIIDSGLVWTANGNSIFEWNEITIAALCIQIEDGRSYLIFLPSSLHIFSLDFDSQGDQQRHRSKGDERKLAHAVLLKIEFQ